ncbi:hypothetical protein DVH05_010437 [Phytophthora capsici]|nr:hypothetical protein DVH05_010437 [Phytophthora capsici]
MTSKAKKTPVSGKKTHLRPEDFYSIVVWLEHAPNFAKCFGAIGKTSIGKQSSKTEGFKEMAALLASSSSGKFRLKPNQMRDRFTTYKNRYLRTKEYENSTGAGVTSEDQENGIFTLRQKLNAMCPWYENMDGLFGKKPNITPLDAYDSTQVDEDVAESVTEGNESSEGSLEDASADVDAFLNERLESGEPIASGTPQQTCANARPRSRSLSLTVSDGSDGESQVSVLDIPLAQLTPAFSPEATQVADATPRRPAAIPSAIPTQPKRPLINENLNGEAVETQQSKKARPAAKPSTLNASPLGARGTGSRIATAMTLVAESKAKGKFFFYLMFCSSRTEVCVL